MSSSRWPTAWTVAFALFLAWPGAAPAQEPSLAELRTQASAGDAEAQNELGGRLLATNDQSLLAEAREWFRRASDGGSVEGMNNYASMLVLGAGGELNEAEGRRLRELAASRGSIGALLNIAESLLAGTEGYERDPARALVLVRTAAESDAPMSGYAQWRLGMMYLNGTGTPPDPREAYRWVARASENNDVSAMISRAVMLATGQGVEENDAEARAWYERAATSRDVNFAHAMRGLGAMLVTGEGGAADVPRGIAYLRIAQAGGDEDAAALLEHWGDLITPEVDRDVWRIVDEWMAEHMPPEG